MKHIFVDFCLGDDDDDHSSIWYMKHIFVDFFTLFFMKHNVKKITLIKISMCIIRREDLLSWYLLFYQAKPKIILIMVSTYAF